MSQLENRGKKQCIDHESTNDTVTIIISPPHTISITTIRRSHSIYLSHGKWKTKCARGVRFHLFLYITQHDITIVECHCEIPTSAIYEPDAGCFFWTWFRKLQSQSVHYVFYFNACWFHNHSVHEMERCVFFCHHLNIVGPIMGPRGCSTSYCIYIYLYRLYFNKLCVTLMCADKRPPASSTNTLSSFNGHVLAFSFQHCES